MGNSPSTSAADIYYTWEVECFSKQVDLLTRAINYPAKSSVAFTLRIYPSVDSKQEPRRYALVTLGFANSDKADDEAYCRLTVGSQKKFLYECTLTRTAGHSTNLLTAHIWRDHLFNADMGLLSKDDKLTIITEITFGSKAAAAPEASKAVLDGQQVRLKQLSADLSSLLKSGDESDVTFVVGGRKFPLHRAILCARSSVLKSMLTGEFVERQLATVEIPDITAEAFTECMQYLYTGQAAQLKKYALELFEAADKYQLESLRPQCEEELISSFSIETISNVLDVADQHNATALKGKCIQYINSNKKAVMQTQSWKSLKKRRPDLVLELYEA